MENFKIDNPDEYRAMLDSAGLSKLPSKKKIWDDNSEAAFSDTPTEDTTTASLPTSSGTPYRSGNPLQFIDNLAGGAGSQIPSTAGSIVGFGGDLVGAINPYSDVTVK